VKIKETTFIIILTVAIGFMTLSGLQAMRENVVLHSDLATANENILQHGEMIAVNDSLMERQVEVINSERRLRKAMEDSIPGLMDRIELLDRDVRSWSRVAAQYKAIIDSGKAVVTVQEPGEPPKLEMNIVEPWGKANLIVNVVDSTIYATTGIQLYQNGIRLEYWLNSTTRDYYMNITHDPFTMDVVLSEDTSGNWVADWQTTNYLDISDINTILVPYRTHWWQTVTFTVGLTTHPALMVGGGIGGWNLGMLTSNVQRQYYLSRTMPIYKLFTRRR